MATLLFSFISSITVLCSLVVALESTIVAHGMPYPQNLELSKDVSQILRSKVRESLNRIHIYYINCNWKTGQVTTIVAKDYFYLLLFK